MVPSKVVQQNKEILIVSLNNKFIIRKENYAARIMYNSLNIFGRRACFMHSLLVIDVLNRITTTSVHPNASDNVI